MKLPVLLVVLAFCSVFTLVGAFLTWKQWQQLQRARAAASWPSSEATILHSELHTDTSGDSTTYEAKVHYRYEVNHQVYTGSRVHHAYGSGGNRAAQQCIVDKLAPGTRVQVRYDPAQPAESTLAAGFTREALPGFLAGLLFFAAGVLFTGIFLTVGTAKSDLAERLVIVQPAAR